MRCRGLILIFLFFYLSSLSQSVAIVDSTGQPVPYATIELPKKNMALFADRNGVIDIALFKAVGKDSLMVSSIGYRTRIVEANKLSGKVILNRQVKELEEAFVFKGKWKKENWGSLKKPGLLFGFGCSWSLNGPGSQIGKIINHSDRNKKPAWIYKIVFYTVRSEVTTPVRLRIYTIGEKGYPDRDLLTHTIIEKIDKGKGWLEFDLADNAIRIPEKGLIVAAEYFDTDSVHWRDRKIVYIDSSGRKREFMEKRYGGNFSTNDEIIQGETFVRANGYWIKLLRDRIKPECENLVVQVWVRYPESKGND